MSGFESVQFGFADFLSLVAYLSQLYEIFRGEIPQTKYFKSVSCDNCIRYSCDFLNLLSSVQESGDELEDLQHHPEHIQAMKELRMAVTAKHHFSREFLRQFYFFECFPYLPIAYRKTNSKSKVETLIFQGGRRFIQETQKASQRRKGY